VGARELAREGAGLALACGGIGSAPGGVRARALGRGNVGLGLACSSLRLVLNRSGCGAWVGGAHGILEVGAFAGCYFPCCAVAVRGESRVS